MSENKTDNVADILNELAETGDRAEYRFNIESRIVDEFKEELSELDALEFETTVQNLMSRLQLEPLAEAIADEVTKRTLFNVSSGRWWADKAASAAVTAAGLVTAAWAANKMGLVGSDSAAGYPSSPFKTDGAGNSPFSDMTPVQPSSYVGQSRPPIRMFDHHAS